jgi:transcriptional regulator with XRE-family HTH domain
VPGPRREEVALLAGVSVDYYVRLEQGRERHPSSQVLEALAGVLRLGADGRRHLHHLAGTAPAPRAGGADTHAGPALQQLVDSWTGPALVHNRANDVLAGNATVEVLFGRHGVSGNGMHYIFLDPASRDVFVEWPAVAAAAVAHFRLASGTAAGDPRVRQVLAELTERSPEFRRLWARHDVRGGCVDRKVVHHPDVGRLVLHGHTFDVRSGSGLVLSVFSAAPGSRDAEALRLLGDLAVARTAGPDGSAALSAAAPDAPRSR